MGKGYYDDNSSQEVTVNRGSSHGNSERRSSSGSHSHHSHHGSEYRHHSSSHSYHEHSSGHHHHHHEDKSSEMERNGDNIIYRKVRKGKLFTSIKRALFCIVIIAFTVFTISAIIDSTPEDGFSLFKRRTAKTEEIEDLKERINKYQDRIDELEAELEQYRAKDNEGVTEATE